MKKFMTLSVAAILLSSTAVLAQSQQAFDSLDSDGNDKLSYTDVRGQWPDLTEAQFDAADADGDDFLDITQFDALKNAVDAGASTEVAASGTVAPKVEIDVPVFALLDQDGNGKLSIDDVRDLGVTQEQFDAADIDNDDFLDAGQYEALKGKLGMPQPQETVDVGMAPQQPRDIPVFEDVDLNGDGKVDFSDLTDLNITQEEFDAADMDNDDFLDRGQYEALAG